MLAGARKFFESKTGRQVAIGLALVGLATAIYSMMSNLRSENVSMSTDRLFICSETGKSFRESIKAGMMIPIHSPYSGKETGYEAELCYWTKDGKIKPDPTPVLRNSHAGKPEPTFCPDCGRMVTALNPAPSEGMLSPPTQAEWAVRRRPER